MSQRADRANAPAIVLIHGLWMTPLSWERWIDYYAALGYQVLAPAWPGMEREMAEIRRDPGPLGSLGVTEIVDHYERIITGLEQPPVIMGHSFGGLFTQILLDRGLGCAGVAIASAPVKGILLLPLSTLRVSFPALSNPFNYHKAVALTPQQFRYAFGNLLSEQESLQAYQRYAVPGPDHLLFQAGLANFTPRAATTVDFDNRHRAPLLLIAGGRDHISPVSVVKANFKLYANSRAETEYKEFPDRSHFILGEPGWEAVADFALDWVQRQLARRTASADSA